jgi:hypothetical protein
MQKPNLNNIFVELAIRIAEDSREASTHFSQNKYRTTHLSLISSDNTHTLSK